MHLFSGYDEFETGLLTARPKPQPDVASLTREDLLSRAAVTLTCTACNRPFPSSLVPLFQSESKCETFHMKMSSACSFIFMYIKVIFIRMVLHLDSLWNRGTRELGNGLLVIWLRERKNEHFNKAVVSSNTVCKYTRDDFRPPELPELYSTRSKYYY